MNKKILAAAALAIVSGSAMADGAQLYGIMDLSVQNITNQDGTKATFTGMSDGLWLPSVWGIKGSEDLGDGMSAHYNLESNLTANTGASLSVLFIRASNVGIKGDFGDITAGQRLDPIWIQSVAEQAMGVRHVGSAGIATGVACGTNYQNPCLTSTTNNNGNTTAAVFGSNWLYYEAPKMIDNVTVNLGYQFGNVAGSTTAASGTYIGVVYAKNGLTVNLGSEVQNNGTSSATNNNKVNRNLVGAMYSFGDFTVEGQMMRVSSSGAAKNYLYSGTTGTGYVDAQIGQAGLAYKISPKLQVGIQYVYVNDNYLNSRPTLTTLGADYGLSKRTHLYAVVENSVSASTNNSTVTNLALPVGYGSIASTANTAANASMVAVGMYHTF
jgi:predicted porin